MHGGIGDLAGVCDYTVAGGRFNKTAVENSKTESRAASKQKKGAAVSYALNMSGQARGAWGMGIGRTLM